MKKTIKIVLILSLVLATDVTNADFTFSTPINLGPTVNSSSYDEAPCISSDDLTLYFGSWRSGGHGNNDLWVTRRSTINDPWQTPENLGSAVNTSMRDGGPRISADGLSLYFNSNRPGGYEASPWGDIWVTQRSTTSDPWGTPVNLGPIINSPSHAFAASISHDGLSLFFGSNRAGGSGNEDIWVTARSTIADSWEEPINLGTTVNSSANDADPSISSDGLALFFSDYSMAPYRSGGYGNADLWITTRPTVSDSWGKPVNLGMTINTSYHDFAPSISGDGSTVFFMSDRPVGYGLWDLWQAQIIPIVDFNSDEIVDSADMRIMIDHWGTDNSLCDIGPMPWGDGIVDVEDLKILTEYLFGDMQCVRHFKLDESRGSIANDSARNRDGTVYGSPQWQPTGGVLGGALQLDGVDDYIKAAFVLNPANGELSVFAWIKGGVPGQVILSQMDSANWLLAGPSGGNLMTELKGTGRTGKPLQSKTIIADGSWHRIGLVWDGSYRTLYVDGVAVAQDTQDELQGSESGLNIGCGKAMEAGTFFSGLIDDVRIYNRAVHP